MHNTVYNSLLALTYFLTFLQNILSVIYLLNSCLSTQLTIHKHVVPNKNETIMTSESMTNFKTPIFIAIIGLIGTGIGASIGGYFNIQLEQQKLRSNLILKAVETNDPKSALDFLIFLKETQLVDGLDLTIESWKDNPEAVPLRPTIDVDEGIFNSNRDTRRKSLQTMIDEDSDNPEKINLILEELEINSFKSLSPQAKVNALYFLNRTNFNVWTEEMKRGGINKIKSIQTHLEDNTLQLGPQAKGELEKLNKSLTNN